MKNSIELSWGGGTFDVLLDVRIGQLFPYFGGVEFHTRYGGTNYYRSCSGASGAGWVSAHPYLVKLMTYRTDVRTSYMFDGCCGENPVTKIPSGVYVPINYSQGVIPEDYPAFYIEAESRVIYFFRQDQVAEFLCGEVDFVHRCIDAPAIKRIGEDVRTWELHCEVSKRCSMSGVRRVLEALHIYDLAFQWPEGTNPDSSLNFWSRLGLRQIGGDLYKISSGIARKRYTREELSTVEALQTASPNNVCVLTPTIYIQEGRYNGYDAVGIFQFDGGGLDFEINLEFTEAFRAMRGDFSKIQRKLEDGATEKHRRAMEYLSQQALISKNQAEREAIFLQLCKEHQELEVSLQDSLSAGNCRPGTEDFRDRTFTGRESVKVKELVRFLSVYGVRRVLEHKLLPLMPYSFSTEGTDQIAELPVEFTPEMIDGIGASSEITEE